MAQTDVHSKLKVYRSKRNFSKTAEPRGDEKVAKHQKLAFVVHRRGSGSKPQWLLIKQSDDLADPDYDPVRDENTSVASERSMEELAGVKAARASSK